MPGLVPLPPTFLNYSGWFLLKGQRFQTKALRFFKRETFWVFLCGDRLGPALASFPVVLGRWLMGGCRRVLSQLTLGADRGQRADETAPPIPPGRSYAVTQFTGEHAGFRSSSCFAVKPSFPNSQLGEAREVCVFGYPGLAWWSFIHRGYGLLWFYKSLFRLHLFPFWLPVWESCSCCVLEDGCAQRLWVTALVGQQGHNTLKSED